MPLILLLFRLLLFQELALLRILKLNSKLSFLSPSLLCVRKSVCKLQNPLVKIIVPQRPVCTHRAKNYMFCVRRNKKRKCKLKENALCRSSYEQRIFNVLWVCIYAIRSIEMITFYSLLWIRYYCITQVWYIALVVMINWKENFC